MLWHTCIYLLLYVSGEGEIRTRSSSSSMCHWYTVLFRSQDQHVTDAKTRGMLVQGAWQVLQSGVGHPEAHAQRYSGPGPGVAAAAHRQQHDTFGTSVCAARREHAEPHRKARIQATCGRGNGQNLGTWAFMYYSIKHF